MRWLTGHAGKYIFLLLMLVCFGHILSTGTLINGYGTPIIYYLNDSPYSMDTVINMKENDETLENYLPFTAVGNLDNQSFSNPDLGKNLMSQLIYVYGSSSMLCTASGELLADDLTGCVLSSEAAWQLFGETNVIGGEVTYDNKTFYIRGVYEDETPIVILPSQSVFTKEEEDGSSFMNMDMPIPGGGQASEASFNKIIVKPDNSPENAVKRSEYVHSFENRWGLSSNKTDCLIYQRLTLFFMMLIPALIFICVMLNGLLFISKNRYKPFWVIGGILGIAVMFTAFFAICQTSPSIPGDMIPNRWSDFDFWGDLIDTFESSIQHILFLNKSEIELAYFKPLVSLSGYTFMGVILFFLSASFFKIEDSRSLFLLLTGTCITELIAIYLLRSSDLIINTKQMLLYLWPYLLIGKFLFYKNKSG